jgi:hypothetical protein
MMKVQILSLLIALASVSSFADVQCPSQGKGNGSDDANCDTRSANEIFNDLVDSIDSTYGVLIKQDIQGSNRWPYHKVNFKKYVESTKKQINLECKIKIYVPYFHGSGAGVDYQYCVIRGKERVIKTIFKELDNNIKSLVK